MPRYKLRTLLIVLALGPPVLAGFLRQQPEPLLVEALSSFDRRLESERFADEANARQRPLGH